MNNNLRLVALKTGGADVLERLAVAVSGLSLAPGQNDFVGVPAVMLTAAMADPARHPFAILAGTAAVDSTDSDAVAGTMAGTVAGTVVGMGVLHVGAAMEAGWPDADGAVLLRGFLIDKGCQGLG